MRLVILYIPFLSNRIEPTTRNQTSGMSKMFLKSSAYLVNKTGGSGPLLFGCLSFLLAKCPSRKLPSVTFASFNFLLIMGFFEERIKGKPCLEELSECFFFLCSQVWFEFYSWLAVYAILLLNLVVSMLLLIWELLLFLKKIKTLCSGFELIWIMA